MDRNEFIARIGTFFFVMAMGFIIIFVVSDIANKPLFDFFFIGVLLGGFGLYIRRKTPSAEPSGRFSTWRKWRSGKLKDEVAERRETKKAERAAKSAERKERLKGSLRSIGRRKKDEE